MAAAGTIIVCAVALIASAHVPAPDEEIAEEPARAAGGR